MSGDVERIEQLRAEIRRHDVLYYVRARPSISDRQYDELMSQLQALESKHPELVTPDSPTQRVGGQPAEGFDTVTHRTAMLSIDNTYSHDDLQEFDTRVNKSLDSQRFHYLVDPKIDGVAISLRYEGGVLIRAVTRGDGLRGDDVTANVRAIRSVPLRLTGSDVPETIEVRGEIYWPLKSFNACNATRADNGLETFANPRNGAAGTLKQLDPKVVAERQLAFIAHGFGEITIDPQPTQASQLMERMSSWGIPANPHAEICDDLAGVMRAIDKWAEIRSEQNYETDGMVVKVDELPLREILGATSKYPRWCIAYKYQAEQAQTVLGGVDFQVGRSGVITPVAHFDPIRLAGTKVSSASLHNFDQIERLDVRIGDSILVEKAGEIIPRVVSVILDKRPAGAKTIPMPTRCPACDYEVSRDEGGVYIRCTNSRCPAQIRRQLQFFAARDQLDIENLGPAVIDQLVDKGLVEHFADLYKLTARNVAPLERMGEKSASNLIEAIEASKSQSPARVLGALGIRHVGSRVARVLIDRYRSFQAIAAAPLEELTEVDEIGPAIAASIRQFFTSPTGKNTIERLADAGLQMESEKREQADTSPGPLEGMSVVVTGTLENLSRSEAENAIQSAGGRAASSISKKTAFVVAGKSPGSKLDKAKSLNVEVIDEAEFLKRTKNL